LASNRVVTAVVRQIQDSRGIDSDLVNALLFLLGATCLTSVGCGSQDDCRDIGAYRRLCGEESVTMPILADDGSATIAARWGEHELRVLVDTGAEMTVLSSKLLGVPDQTVTVLTELCIGALCLRNEPVYAWETPFSSTDGSASNGFIGMRTLAAFSLEIDHGSSVTLAFGSRPCAGDSIPLAFGERGTPRVGVGVDVLGASEVGIDTGSVYTLLSQATADSLPSTSLAGEAPASICTVDGCQPSGAFTAELAGYCVGGACESKLGVKYPVFDGVGMTYFARRKTRFDFPDKRLWRCAE
jgi:hypothetical protein